MHLTLSNFVVGVFSFWNFTAPAVALLVLVVGFIVWGLAKQRTAARFGMAVIVVGFVALVVSAGFDVSRNVHDANELESAAYARYGVMLGFAEANSLFDSRNITHATVGGQTAAEYGSAEVESGNKTVTAFLDRLADGSFVLAVNNKELPLAS